MREKKGSAHFEMIIGFVFFVGFVFFLFMFLSPWSDLPLPGSALEGLYDVFIESVTTELSSVFVSTNASAIAGPCFYMDLPAELFIKQNITGKNTRVTLLGGASISAEISGDELTLLDIDDFFRVAISPEFADNSATCAVPNFDFSLGGVVEIEVVSYSALVLNMIGYSYGLF